MPKRLKLDEIGIWSEVKLEIVKQYATEYSKILAKQSALTHVYVDAFSGAGVHLRKQTGEMVLGSPSNVLLIKPPFKKYWFIDLDETKTGFLSGEIGDRSDVRIRTGDCNAVLLDEVFPTLGYKNFMRALCLIDPYGLHLNWSVPNAAGSLRTTEIFLNFPIADMNRNVLLRNPSEVDPREVDRMNRFWGDDSWRGIVYSSTDNLFGWEEKTSGNAALAEAYRKRLVNVAGFKHVPNPLPMRNNEGANVYYLFFASPNEVANKIVTHIFDKFRGRGSVA